MSAPAKPAASKSNADGQAKIASARVIAAHDGVAELLVSIVYPNGGRTEVQLDRVASEALMLSCDASSIADLTGHGWEKVRDALAKSFNRYQ